MARHASLEVGLHLLAVMVQKVSGPVFTGRVITEEERAAVSKSFENLKSTLSRIILGPNTLFIAPYGLTLDPFALVADKKVGEQIPHTFTPSFVPQKAYVSRRGFPLIWSMSGPPATPVITAEFYCKWYELYVVHADGHCTTVGYEELEDYAPKGESAFCDHTPNPNAIHHFAEARGWDIDDIFREVCVGRYYEESHPEIPPL